MSVILDWIKKHVWQTILIGLAAFFVPLIFVHVAYRISAVSPWFSSTWNPGELITYIAGFEAFIGTVVLGAVAIHQNDKANDLNERMLINEENRARFERQPTLTITRQKVEYMSLREIFNLDVQVYSSEKVLEYIYQLTEAWENLYYFFPFSIKNHSNNNIEYSLKTLKLVDVFDTLRVYPYEVKPISFFAQPSILEPHQESSFGFIIDKSKFEKNDIKQGVLELLITNNIGETYLYKIIFIASITKDNRCFFRLGNQTFQKV